MELFNFIERLNEEELKRLTYLGLLECDKESNTYFLFNKKLDDVEINNLEKGNDYYSYSSLSYDDCLFNTYQYNTLIYESHFIVNNYEMRISIGKWSLDLSDILHMYLTKLFEEEYLNALMDKRIEDAIKDNEHLINDTINHINSLEHFQKERNKKYIKEIFNK